MWDAPTTPPTPTTPPEPGTLDDGIALVLKAEQDGGWRPVIAWLARHPAAAAGLADFLDTGERIKAVLPALAGPARVPGLELLEELDRGSFGIVHRAHDPALRKDVAVKFVQALGEEGRARFRFEAEAAAAIDDANVVPVYSSGEADGVPYLVMKFMPGGSLQRWLRDMGPDRRLPPDEAARIVADIALGTHAVHRHGLIHRDLKPGNVLRDEGGSWRITDFGLARLAERASDVTRTGAIVGTPAYMAPEQARGEKRLTTAVDVHALGVILFELLTGRTPFAGEDQFSILFHIIEEEAPPLRSRRADVPADLETICRRCLEKRPEDRYPSARALADDLTRFLAGEPVEDPKRGLLEEALRAVGRRVPTRGIGTWPMAFLGAANSTLTLGAVQAAVLLDAPAWVAWAALACYFLGWAVVSWVIAVRLKHTLSPVERASVVIQLAMKLAALAILPPVAWLHGGAVAPVFAPMFVIIGLGLFIGGYTFWGRLYLVGLLQLAAAASLPLVPLRLWPGVYCLSQLAVQLWFGWEVWRIHNEDRRDPARAA